MSTAANGYEGTGAGGKIRRKPIRNCQSTPYDRPPIAIRNPSTGNGWVSKIIEPASKIITASAHRFFSSLFRKRLLPPSSRQQTPPPIAANLPAPEVARTSDSESRGEIPKKVGEQYGTVHFTKEPDSLGNNFLNQEFHELVKMLEQKTFTKSEIDRLTALLNSRTVEAPVESTPEAMASETVYTNENLKAPLLTPVLDDGIESEEYIGARSSPLANTKVFEEHITTPAEVANAYMGSRSSKVSPSMLSSRGLAKRNDVPLINYAVFPSQSSSMNTETKSSSQLIKPENGYMTPRSRGRSAIYSMARTPYSRMPKNSNFRSSDSYSFQSSQLALESDKLSDSRKTTLKRRSSVLDDNIGSVEPVRKIRQKPGLLPSQRFNGPATRDGPGLVSNNCSKDAGNGTSDIPSQSSEVAQKILQQLDKLSPSPKEKLSERRPIRPQGKAPFTLTPDMLTGQALRSLEDIDSFKFMEPSQENSRLNDSIQRVKTNMDYNTTYGMNQVEENGPKRMSSFLNSDSETTFYASERPLARNKQAFQMSAQEDYLDLGDNNGYSNGISFSMAKNMASLVNSYEENKTQMVNVVAAKENSVSVIEKRNVSNAPDRKKSEHDQAAFSGPLIPENKDKFSYSTETPTVAIQPTVNDNASSFVFGKVSLGVQSPTMALFGHDANIADTFAPITSLSAPLANDSQALCTVPSEFRTPNLSVLSDPVITKPDLSKGAQGPGDREGNPSTDSSYDVSTISTLFSSGSYANNGFSNGSFSGQPAMASASAPLSSFKKVSDDGACNLSSSAATSFSTSVPNTEAGITSGSSVCQLSTSSAPFSAPVFSSGTSFKDPQVSSNANGSLSVVEEKLKSVSAVSNTSSNPFGGIRLSSGMSNSTNVISGFGSSASSPIMGNQGLGSLSNNSKDIISQAPTVGTASEDVSKSTPFQFGSSGFSSTPFGLSGTAAFASASAGLCVSTPADVFGMPGSLFGSTGASAGSTFSFTSASANTSPSPFSAQPLFGSPKPAFTFGITASPANNGGNNNQISMEDSMAEDTAQASAPSTPLFGQQQSNHGFVFGSTPSSVTLPATGLFQFGSQPSPAAPVSQSPSQGSSSFNAGGSFSWGTGGGDKSGRKIIKVKKGLRKR